VSGLLTKLERAQVEQALVRRLLETVIARLDRLAEEVGQ